MSENNVVMTQSMILAVFCVLGCLEAAVAYPQLYQQNHCEPLQPSHHFGHHKAPVLDEAIKVILEDTQNTEFEVTQWLPGTTYAVTVLTPADMQALIAVSSGGLMGADGSIENVACEGLSIASSAQGTTHNARWIAPACCTTNESEVQFTVTGACGKHAHYRQGQRRIEGDFSSCTCEEIVSMSPEPALLVTMPDNDLPEEDIEECSAANSDEGDEGNEGDVPANQDEGDEGDEGAQQTAESSAEGLEGEEGGEEGEEGEGVEGPEPAMAPEAPEDSAALENEGNEEDEGSASPDDDDGDEGDEMDGGEEGDEDEENDGDDTDQLDEEVAKWAMGGEPSDDETEAGDGEGEPPDDGDDSEPAEPEDGGDDSGDDAAADSDDEAEDATAADDDDDSAEASGESESVDAVEPAAGEAKSSDGLGGGGLVAVVVLLLGAAGVGGIVIMRRARQRRAQYTDFGALEMRGYARWSDEAGM